MGRLDDIADRNRTGLRILLGGGVGGAVSFKQIGSYPSWDQLVALTHAKT